MISGILMGWLIFWQFNIDISSLNIGKSEDYAILI